MNENILRKLVSKIESGVLLDINVANKKIYTLFKRLEVIEKQNISFLHHINGLNRLNSKLIEGSMNFKSMLRRYSNQEIQEKFMRFKGGVCNFCGRRFINTQAVRAHLKGCDFYKERKFERKKMVKKEEEMKG